jgi:mono/diheme cytochrome c family protein
MRERWARRLALSSGVLLVAIAAALAAWHNRAPNADNAVASAPPSQPVANDALEHGGALYREHGCARCHAIAGVGNPRSPLDGVGLRHDAAQLRQWITADAAIAETLSTRTRTVKSQYAALPPADLDALVIYLQSLPTP